MIPLVHVHISEFLTGAENLNDGFHLSQGGREDLANRLLSLSAPDGFSCSLRDGNQFIRLRSGGVSSQFLCLLGQSGQSVKLGQIQTSHGSGLLRNSLVSSGLLSSFFGSNLGNLCCLCSLSGCLCGIGSSLSRCSRCSSGLCGSICLLSSLNIGLLSGLSRFLSSSFCSLGLLLSELSSGLSSLGGGLRSLSGTHIIRNGLGSFVSSFLSSFSLNLGGLSSLLSFLCGSSRRCGSGCSGCRLCSLFGSLNCIFHCILGFLGGGRIVLSSGLLSFFSLGLCSFCGNLSSLCCLCSSLGVGSSQLGSGLILCNRLGSLLSLGLSFFSGLPSSLGSDPSSLDRCDCLFNAGVGHSNNALCGQTVGSGSNDRSLADSNTGDLAINNCSNHLVRGGPDNCLVGSSIRHHSAGQRQLLANIDFSLSFVQNHLCCTDIIVHPQNDILICGPMVPGKLLDRQCLVIDDELLKGHVLVVSVLGGIIAHREGYAGVDDGIGSICLLSLNSAVHDQRQCGT